MYSAGDTVEARTLTTIDGSQVRVPAPDHTVHLQFRRFAGSTSLIGGLAPRENHLGKPADFLIGPDGTIRACKYGVHADDQWSVDEVLRLAKAE